MKNGQYCKSIAGAIQFCEKFMNPVTNPVTGNDANTYSYKTPPSSPKVPHVLDPKVLSKNYTYSFSRVSASFNGTVFFRSLDDYEDLSTTSEEELMRIHDDQTDDRVVFLKNTDIGSFFNKGK